MKKKSERQKNAIAGHQAMKELKALFEDRFPQTVEKMIFFGSRTKEISHEYSDYDVLVIVKNGYDWKFENSIYETAYDIDLKHEILIDIKIISNQELGTLKGKQPFVKEAIEKGIVL